MPTTQDVLDDIEFELMQGAVAHDDLGQAVQSVKQYQNKLRGELFASGKLDRNTLAKLLQINDMLLTLLQEMSAVIHSTRQDIRRIASAPRLVERVAADMVELNHQVESGGTDDLAQAMREETIHVSMQARLAHLPVIGRVIGPLQIFFQRPALYYVQLFADRQAPVNRTFGDWILKLNDWHQHDGMEIARLNQRIAELEARIQSDSK